MGQVLTPDLVEAQRFLDAIEDDGIFHFQLAHESPMGSPLPARIRHGRFVDVQDELTHLNIAGMAIWVQINSGTGRKNQDINRIRAYFVDQDDGGSELLFKSPFPADIIVESSPGKHHGYWLTAGAPLEPYVARMQALADRFKGDRAICNLGRVMRLPGFLHHKNEPFLSHVVHNSTEVRHV